MLERAGKLVLLSNSVFTSTEDEPFAGFVAIEDNKIEAVGTKADAEPYVAAADRVIDAGDRTIIAGLTDDHTFFTGWALLHLGADLAGIHSAEEGIAALNAYATGKATDAPLFGHNWEAEGFSPDAEEALCEAFPSRPVVAFTADRGTCWMNACARERYGFTPEECYAEKIWRMMRDYLATDEVKRLYGDYMQMLNSRGVTQIKEMTFDDYYGFMDQMERMEQADELTVRVSMMSQPVGEGINIAHGKAMVERFKGDFVSFSGYNRMTDRSIASGMAELKEPYASAPNTCCAVPVEWELIADELSRADEAGFRYSLHCQGNAAVAHTVDLYEKCARDESGRLSNRHAITDLEFSDPEDLERFGALGGICEVYPQIQSLDDKPGLLKMVEEQIGLKRFEHYWMRRAMWDAGCVVCGGTDLPLMLPSLGEAIYCGVGGYFDDGGRAREENMLTVAQMVKAWTINGAYDCYAEDRLGSLEAGKLADVVVLEADVFNTDPKDLRNVNAALTISDGRIVFDQLG